MIIRLPAWRPGRYQLMHFSRNIQRFEVLDAEGKPLAYRKTGQESWVLDTRNTTAALFRSGITTLSPKWMVAAAGLMPVSFM